MGVRLRASFAEVFLACPISATLIRQYPSVDDGNAFTQRGIRLHDLGAWLLRDKFNIPQPLLEPEKCSLTEIEDVVKYTQFAGQLVYDVFGGIDDIKVEVECEIDLKDVLLEGTGYIDLLVYDPKNILVVDYKSGFVRVFPKGNPQTYVYALGVLYKLRKMGLNPENIFVAIAQPSQRNTQMHHISSDDLIAWHNEHKQAIEDAHNGVNNFVAGPHCEKCPFQGSCSHNLKHLLKGVN